MPESTIDLEYLAYDCANFAHSEKEPTSMSSLIKSSRSFFYQWTKDEGIEILTFTDPTKPETAKLFRYSKKQMFKGMDLENDVPAIIGNKVVEVLEEYVASR